MGPDMPFVDFDPYYKDVSVCEKLTEFEKKYGKVTIQGRNNGLSKDLKRDP
ncbi:hypothetical protein [Leptospira santarosai]|uniref:hypothetical protein n=1 Tax=Leptospira santarosai TaxID=28183 RepID=UPI001912495D|nr:hypothetical protein [Leptospira santarosai]